MGHILADPADLTVPPALVDVASMPGTAGRMVIVTVPQKSRPVVGDRVATIVAQAVRSVVERPGDDAPAGAAADDMGEPAAPAIQADEVVAAHDARIAILRQHLDALAGEPGSARLASVMGERLRRAEAARRLAVVRAGGERLAVTGASPNESAPPIGTDNATMRAALRVRRSPPAAAAMRELAAYPVAVAAGYRRAHPARVRVAIVGRMAPAGGRYIAPTQRGGLALLAEPSGHTLTNARRLLAAARRSLGAPAWSGAAPRIALAGLWRWNGSDTWTLRAGIA